MSENGPLLSLPCEDRYLFTDGRRTRYWESGQTGEALILVHGLGGSVEQWALNVEALSATHRVFCLDMPGCGRSDPLATDDYTLASLARSLDSFVRAKDLRTFSLVGLSMGGAICLRYALDFPRTVRTVVSVGGAALGPRMAFVFRALTLPVVDAVPGLLSRDVFARFVRSMVFDPAVVGDDVVDFYYPLIKNPVTRQAFLRTLKANCSILGLRRSVRDGVISRLRTVAQPVLIIWGRQDRHMPLRNAREALTVLPSANLVIFDRCRHNPQFERPDEFNRSLLAFLDR